MINRKTELYICLIMLIFPAQEIGFASWLPTYAIKAGITDTEGSAIYSMYFWLPNAIARFVWAFLITAPVTYRMQVIKITITGTAFLLLILQYL